MGVLLGRKTTTLLLDIVMVGLLLLLALHAIVGRQVPSSEHFSQVVQVAVEEKEEDGEVRLVVGNLKLHLGRRAGEHLLDRVLVQEVLPEAKHLLGESLYAGDLEGDPECAAHAFIEDNQVKTASVFCPRLLWVVEGGSPGQATLHRRPQISPTERYSKRVEKTCRLFIHTDPFMWRHLTIENIEPRRAALRMMVDHVLAADNLYRRALGVQFLLAGWQVDDDSRCSDEEEEEEEWVPDYSKEYEDYWEEYQEYSADELQLYQDFINDEEYEDDSWREEDWESTLHTLRNPTNRSEIASLENVTLLLDLDEESMDLQNTGEAGIVVAGNCYESFDGVVDVGKAFCTRFPSTSSAKLLNMFSTVDHSGFCLAHIWTYRDLDVVGLADSPTEGAPGLSGFCAEYDRECATGFNTGLISFRHRGKRLSLVDSQDTFLHELGHSLGSGHNPQACSDLSSGAHYLMWGGAVSTGQVVREFSSCSLEEINAALGGFPNSCLHNSTMTAGPTAPTRTSSSTTAATSAPSSPPAIEVASVPGMPPEATPSSPALTSSTTPAPSSPRCKATLIQKQLSALTRYVRDLWHLQDDNSQPRKIFGSVQRKLLKLTPRYLEHGRRRDSSRLERLVERAMVAVRRMETSEELSVWLGRRLERVAQAVKPCLEISKLKL